MEDDFFSKTFLNGSEIHFPKESNLYQSGITMPMPSIRGLSTEWPQELDIDMLKQDLEKLSQQREIIIFKEGYETAYTIKAFLRSLARKPTSSDVG